MNDSSPPNQTTDSLRKRNPIWFLLAILPLVIWIAFIPGVGSGPSAPRAGCKNNLKQLLLALDLYHDDNGSYPPAYVADKNGRPLYSWRVLILPYIDEKPLHQMFRLDEAWDSSHNLLLSKTELEPFWCPSDQSITDGATTNYLAVVGPNAAWIGDKALSKKEFADPLSKTILLVEAVNAGIHWAEPRDLYVNQIPMAINPKQGTGISSHHEGCAQVGMCDGSIVALHDNLAPNTIKQLINRNDGVPAEYVGE